ncbi:hypothetical protein ACLKMH_02005 [Psychromonas sp. KJ10-10]|uniref:hypothetical protein n=1 Tax=Psychromonas sp. KJ10-10 TaxID=3391823 RepID=UPI0039B66629
MHYPCVVAVLLANQIHKVSEVLFLKHLDWHQQWLALNAKGSLVTYQKTSAQEVLQQGLAQQKFEHNDAVVSCTESQALILNYYRNNIVHLFVLPSLVCHSIDSLISEQIDLTLQNIDKHSQDALSVVQQSYFLNSENDPSEVMTETINKLVKLDILTVHNEVYQVLDETLFMLLKGHLDNPFDKPTLAN